MNSDKLREEYEDRLYQHPSLKGIRPIMSSSTRATGVSGEPRLVSAAMADQEVATAIAAVRRVRAFEDEVDDLAQRRLKKEPFPRAQEETLLNKGQVAEEDFRNSVRILARKARISPNLNAYGEAAREIPVPGAILGDIPSYWNQDEREAMTYLGWGPEHPAWKEIGDRSRSAEAGQNLSHDAMAKLLENIERSAPKLDYARSPRHLQEQGILTIVGNDWLDDLVWLCLFLLIFLPWLFWQTVSANSPWIVTYVLGALGFPV